MRYRSECNRKKTWKRRRRRLGQTSLLLALLLGLGHVAQVSAGTIQEANDKKDEAQNELNSVNQKIGQIEQKQGELQTEINALDAELVDVILSLNILEGDLEKKEIELEQRTQELAQAQADEEEQYQAMKKRIRFMYERGDTAVLTVILESKSITDLINRVEYYNKVYDCDRELLVTYQNVKLQVAELKTQVEYEIAEMEELQANYQEEQARYETLIAQKRGELEDFDVKLADAQSLARQYQDTIDQQNEIIRQEEQRLEEERKERERQAEAERLRQQQEAAAAAANNNNSSNSGNNTASSNNGGGSSGNGGGEEGSGDGGGKNPDFTTGISGSEVVNYACTFIGNPYVYGGTDINNGIDCSAFVQQVFGHFGVKLPRDSYSQRTAGKEVSYSNAQPGDIICYSGHVAIYMGGGQIVHASNSQPYPAGGIKTGTATYRTIVSVRRVL